MTTNQSQPASSASGLPPTAPLPSVIQTIAGRVRPLEYFEWCRRRLGPRFTITPIDMPPLVCLSDPDDIREILAAPLTMLHPGAGASVTAPLLGARSFMLLEEEERMNGRDAIAPALHRNAVARYADMVGELAEREVSCWPRGTPTPLHPRLSVLAITVMLRTVFGTDDPAIEPLCHSIHSMLSVTSGVLLQEPRARRLPRLRVMWSRFIRDREEVDHLIAGVVARRRRVPGDHIDMLEMLINTKRLDGSPMSASELRDNLLAVIVAGSETTASSLAWAFQLLAHHPRVQDRLVDELDAGTGEDYLKATVSETLRHRPVFLFATPRAVVEPIDIGGWTYHPPVRLLACIYLMHHDPTLFTEPNAFRPERFLDSRGASRTWLPWGGGRQCCPGRHLALLELRTVLRAALSTLRVLPSGTAIERARWRSVIVTPHAGSTVILRKRGTGSRRAANLSTCARHSTIF